MKILIKINLIWISLLLLVFIGVKTAHAQVPANPIGLNPTGLKWSQINTDIVQVVFPKGMDEQGQRVARLVHFLHNRDNPGIGNKKGKVSIFLQNQGAISNGFVTVGPFRSEFYTTPPQFDCTADWIDLLAIHEYRHVQQFFNARRGITNLARVTLGSWAWGGLMATALPRWYFEGDAVIAETGLSTSGRGRLPAFEMEYKALLQANRRPNYEKAAAGSLKEFIPDWYTLGYYMMSYGRKHHGADLWQKVAGDAVQYKGLIFPFNHNLKKHSGRNTTAFYNEMMDELDSLWQPSLQSRNQETALLRSGMKKKNTLIHYNNPHYLDAGALLVEKRGFDQLPTYYRIDKDGTEKRLARPGVLLLPLNTTLSIANDKICWAELAFDLRWANRTYSIIKTQDLKTGKKTKLTSKSRYYSPAFSSTGDRIVAVEVTTLGQASLVILDAADGTVLKKLENAEGWFYSFPRWMEGDEALVVVAKRGGAQQLQRIDIQSSRNEALTPLTNSQLSHPFPKGDRVYFSAAYTGTNNIFVVERSGRLRQLTDVALGAFQPAISSDGGWLAYSSFTADGYEIREVLLNPKAGEAYTPAPLATSHYAEIMAGQEGGDVISQLPTTEFPVKKFRKTSGLLNPHSLLPLIDNPIFGASILSNNKFSTLTAEAGAYYNRNDKDWTFLANLSYAELFPVLNASYRFSNRSGFFINFDPVNDSTIYQTNYVERWTEHRAIGGITLPLNLSAGRYSTTLRLTANYQRLDLDIEDLFDHPNNGRDTFNVVSLPTSTDLFRERLTDGGLNAMDLRLTFFSFRRRAEQHIQSRFGFVFDARYRKLLGGGSINSDVLYLRADLYLPGLFRTHSFYINTLYQRQDMLDNYRFPDIFRYPRGHNGSLRDDVYKIGFNYSIPLFYPDLPIRPLAFIKRVKANFFYDFGRFSSDRFRSFNLRSTGVELTFDMRLFRLVEADMGLRYSYLLDEGLGLDSRHQFEFLVLSITQ